MKTLVATANVESQSEAQLCITLETWGDKNR